jgi:hypothetical protein
MSINPESSPNPPKRQDHFLEYLKSHPREVISYAMLIVGIILLFFQPVAGGILVGLVAGIYFSEEIVAYITDWKMGVNAQAFTKHVICIGVALAFFIAAPAIFLGIAIAIGIKQLFVGQPTEPSSKS